MDFFFLLFVILPILGVLGSVLWFVFFVWLAKKALSGAQRDLNRILPSLEQLIQSYSMLPPGQQIQQRMQIMNMLTQANNQMRNLQDIHRQQYDLRVSQLQGMAADAGIDWTPP